MTLLERLRKECDAPHQALHQHKLLAPLADGTMTMERYKTVITMFHAAYAESEQRKPAHSLPDAPVLDWLEADMALHHITPLPAAPAADVSSLSKWVGYLYVKQGSTLGGQLITRRLKHTLALEPGMDNHFFHGYGKETGAYWQKFRNQVIAMEDQLLKDEVIHAAALAFDTVRICADRMAQGTR